MRGDGSSESEGFFYPNFVSPVLLPVNHLRAEKDEIYDSNLVYQRMPAPLGLEATPTYDPFQESPALYREFAELNTAHLLPEILKFANKWGTLGGNKSVQVELVDEEFNPINDKQYSWAEMPGSWLEEILEMRMALEIWDMVRSNDRESLIDLIYWEDGGIYWKHRVGDHDTETLDDDDLVWSVDVETGERSVSRINGLQETKALVSVDEYHPERRFHLDPDQPGSAANYVIGDIVSDGLAARVSAQLEPPTSGAMPTIRLVPDSLIGALWLQFANAVNGNIDYKRCEECRTWLEISPGAGRPDRSYCSDACRMRAYRKRKRG